MIRNSIFALVFGIALLSPNATASTILIANLAGTNEFPPNASPGTGLGTFTLSADQSTLDVLLFFSGLVALDTAAHIHCCAPPGVNAAVRLNLTGFPLGVTSGSYSHTFTLATDLVGITPADFVTGLLGGQTYANIHTSQFPGGEIRGQIVPEPSMLGLIVLGLAGIGVLRRRTASSMNLRS